MSRIGKQPVTIPDGVDVSVSGNTVTVKGKHGELTLEAHPRMNVVYDTDSREITVNYEKQLIKLTGIIRPDDIDSNNVILSTYISDAKIIYSGSGVIQKPQKTGLLGNVINKILPF